MNMRWKWIGMAMTYLGLCAAVLTNATISTSSPAMADEKIEERSGWLGVMLNGSDDDAVAVVGVTPGSPAEAAGLQKGDEIVRVDGQPVGDLSSFVKAIRSREPGDQVTLELVDEDGASREATATLGERNRKIIMRSLEGSDFSMSEIMEHVREGLQAIPEHIGPLLRGFPSDEGEAAEPVGFLGVSLLEPSDDLRRTLGGIEGAGVLVNKIVEDSAAETAGLLAGDLITRVDGEEVDSSMSLTRAIRAKKPGDVVRVELIRDRSTMTLDATLGETKGMHRFRMIHPGKLEGIPGGLHLEHLDETLRGALGNIEIDSDALVVLSEELELEGLDEKVREALERAHEALEGLELDSDDVIIAPGGRVLIHPDIDSDDEHDHGKGDVEQHLEIRAAEGMDT